MTVDRTLDRVEQRTQHVHGLQHQLGGLAHAKKFPVAHAAQERLGVMGELRQVVEREEGRGPLERVERAKDGIDRVGVVWFARELLHGQVSLVQQLPALDDKIEQECAVGVGRQE